MSEEGEQTLVFILLSCSSWAQTLHPETRYREVRNNIFSFNLNAAFPYCVRACNVLENLDHPLSRAQADCLTECGKELNVQRVRYEGNFNTQLGKAFGVEGGQDE